MYVCMYCICLMYVCMYVCMYLSGCGQDGQGAAEEAAEQTAQHSPETAALHRHPGARVRLGCTFVCMYVCIHLPKMYVCMYVCTALALISSSHILVCIRIVVREITRCLMHCYIRGRVRHLVRGGCGDTVPELPAGRPDRNHRVAWG